MRRCKEMIRGTLYPLSLGFSLMTKKPGGERRPSRKGNLEDGRRTVEVERNTEMGPTSQSAV